MSLQTGDHDGPLQPQREEFHLERYRVYERLRRTDPVCWDESRSAWLVTRYADVVGGLRNTQLSVKRESSAFGTFSDDVQSAFTPLRAFYARWLMFSDPPQHTRVRNAVAQTLTGGRVRGLEPWLRERVGTLLKSFVGNQRSDVIAGFAQPLAIGVMAHLMGLPEGDYQTIKGWSDRVVGFLGLSRPEPKDARAAQQSILELSRYLGKFVKDGCARQDNLIAGLAAAMEADSVITEEELIATCCNILVDGHEPITSLIGNGLLALSAHPDQYSLLRRDDALVNGALEEFLRYDSPFQYAARRATTDVRIGDKTVRAGQRVMLMLGAANRDPERFANPDVLEISRADNRHCAFGFGSHFCPGATLARTVGAVALRGVLDTFPLIAIDTTAVEWKKSLGYRGLERLHIRYGAGC